MPQKEIDIVINDRDIEQSEKKLISMDRMLQQTQRRAAVLGRTRMTPVISLDDRFSTKARLISHRITLLDRMSANPIVWLIDNASAGINKIRNSLSQLTRTPWRVTLSGLNWDVVTGTSFADLLGDESLYTEVGKKAGETYFEAFLSVLDPQRITDILGQFGSLGNSQFSSNSHSHSESRGTFSSKFDKDSGESAGKSSSFPEATKDIFMGSAESFATDMADEQIGYYYRKAISNGDNWLSTSSSGKGITKYGGKAAGRGVGVGTIVDVISIATAEPGKETYEAVGGALGGSFLGTVGAALGSYVPVWGNIVLGALGGGIGSWLGEKAGGFIYDVVHQEPKPVTYSDRAMAPSLQGIVKPEEPVRRVMGTPVPDTFPSNPSGTTSSMKNQIKQEVNNSVNDVASKGTNEILNKIGYINPVERINQIINGNKLINSNSPIQFPTNQSAVPGITSNEIKQEVDNSVNVSLTPGAINLTIQKDEINYDDIAQKTGSMIANQVRFAMMNMS